MKGMNANTAKTTKQVHEDNYLEIMKLAGVGPADDSYIAALVNGKRGTGRK